MNGYVVNIIGILLLVSVIPYLLIVFTFLPDPPTWIIWAWMPFPILGAYLIRKYYLKEKHYVS